MSERLKIRIFFVFLVLSNVILGQDTQSKQMVLDWNSPTVFSINSSKKIQVPAPKNSFLNSDLIPLYSSSWNVNLFVRVANYSLKNIVFETLPKKSLKDLNIAKIPTQISSEFNIVRSKTSAQAVFSLIPFVKEGNSIKKVISFELEYVSQKTNNFSSRHSTVKNSVLATGKWYKFSVDTTGVYKIDKSFLQSLGIDVSRINPKNIQIFGNGGQMLPFKNSSFRYDGLQENAIYVAGENDNSFDNGDYILFYAKGPHQWVSNSSSPTLNQLSHQYNIFSEAGYYFITIGNTAGKRISSQPQVTAPYDLQVTTFQDHIFYEKDEVNLFAVGQQWFGESFNIENVQTFSIPFNNLVTSNDVIIKVRAVAESSLTSQMEVSVNNQHLFNIDFSAASGLTKAVASENRATVQLSGSPVNISITFNNNGNPSAKAYLDYIEVLGTKKLTAGGKQFSFRNYDVGNTQGVFEYVIENAVNISRVWNVTDPITPLDVQNESTTSSFNFKVNGGVYQEYVVLSDEDYYTPQIIANSVVGNQNLHSLKDIDYVIITQDFLLNQAQRLADYHSQNSNLKTAVIPLHQIYNEFSSGAPDITAIRDFVKHLYDNATTNQVKYVCLFGDASYDYKDRIGGNNNIVPVFEAYNSLNLATSFVTDDFYGMMDDNEGEMNYYEKQDVITGRIPVSDPVQAEQVVDKILSYYSSQSLGSWRTNLTLVADDIDAAGEETLQINMEQIAVDIEANKPLFNLKKIYIDAYIQEISSGGTRYPTVNIDLTNQIEKGTLLVDYFGHGGEDGWAGERILEVPEIQNYKNKEKLPLFITVTCEFSRFDNPLRKTAGEFVIWNENGGAASLVSTTREIFISVGEAINERLIKLLLEFNNENYSIAESLIQIKNQFSTTQRYFIYYLGDPAMHLNVPKPNVKLTKMNDVAVTQSLDTIKALSYVKFEGEVTDLSGTIINNFNGELDVTVFDKAIHKTTLDNDNFNITMDFDAIESVIFKGRSKVENGIFNFDFVAPRDLKIAYGQGKLSLYAENGVDDRAGFNFDVVVGGINTNAPEDNTGPLIKLYMNDLNFVDGGNTNESPLFLAVLEDENGINTSITAVDHDIVAILDGDQTNPIILNDYYQTELNNYKKGNVRYPFRGLSPGLHTITLKVWDTYNNMSEATLTFIVVSDSDLVLSNVLNYPNPFINYTEFWFNHNKPNELLNVQIQIFTISGKLVKTINETVQSEGNLSRTIVWNGLDDFGSKIGKGVYIYKLKVKSLISNTSAEKIEKLVILQ